MKKIIQILLMLLLYSGALYADVGINVYDESVYAYLEKLAAAKLIKTYSPNQRPLSRISIAKLIVEARENNQGNTLIFVIAELENKFSEEVDVLTEGQKKSYQFVPIDKASLEWTATNQPEYAMPSNNLGATAGTVQPLLSFNDGRHYQKYGNFYFDTSHWLTATPYFAFYIQPQAYGIFSSDTRGGIGLYRGYLKTGAGNFEFQIGRDDIFWGPGKYSIFFSNNARAQDIIRLTTPHTFRFPWIFKYLGQWRFSTVFSWLNRDYTPRNAILSAYRVDYQPFYWWDIGFDHAVFMGGRGARDPNFSTAVGEYIGFLFDSGNSKASSNHLMGIDMLFRIPLLKGFEFYGKMLLEDTQAEYGFMLKNDATWLGGIYFPRVSPNDKLSLRGEFVHSGEFAYRHWFYTDGFAIDGKFIGYDAGSDTYSGMLETSYRFNLDEFLTASCRYLMRSSNTYNGIYTSSGNNIGIAVDVKGVTEHHAIMSLSGQKKLSKRVNFFGEFGIDATKNQDFVAGKNAANFAVQFKFVFHDLIGKK